MNTNTTKLAITALLTHLMCMSVVLSHIHAKDAVSFMNQHTAANKLSGSDITAKALGDLHNHIDKTGLKNIHSTVTARGRSMALTEAEEIEQSLASHFRDFLLRVRVVASLCVQNF